MARRPLSTTFRYSWIQQHRQGSLTTVEIAYDFASSVVGNGRGDADAHELLAGRTVILDADHVRRGLVPPRYRDALLRYVEMESTMAGASHGAIMAELAALETIARKSDSQLGTHYLARIEQHTDWFQRQDMYGALATTERQGRPVEGPAWPSRRRPLAAGCRTGGSTAWSFAERRPRSRTARSR